MKHTEIKTPELKSVNAMRMEMAPPGYKLRRVEGPKRPDMTDSERWRAAGNATRAAERDLVSPGTRAAH